MNPKLKKALKIIIPIAIVIVIIWFLFFRGGSSSMYIEEKASTRDVITYHTFTGNIQADNEVSLYPKTSQTVTEVKVKEGAEVKAGEVLALLDDTTIQQNIALKEATLSNTELTNYYAVRDSKKTYSDYQEGIDSGSNTQLNTAQASLTNAETAYRTATETYERAKLELEGNIDSTMIAATGQLNSAKTALENAQKSYDENEAAIRGDEKGVSNAEDDVDRDPSASNEAALSAAKANLTALENKRVSLQQAIDSATTTFNNAYNSYLSSYNTANTTLTKYYNDMMAKYDAYTQAQANYNAAALTVSQTLNTYANAAEKAGAVSNTNVATVELNNLYAQLDDYKIIATIDGTLTDFNLKLGDMVTSGKSAATITDYSKVKVAIKINEYDIQGVEEGKEVDINIDALNRDYKGTLTNVSKKATIDKGVSYFEADVEFAADQYVRSGMSAEVKIKNNDVAGALTVSANAIHYENDNTAYVMVYDTSKKAVKKVVSVGSSDGTYIQITDGLAEGDIVLTTPVNNMEMMMNAQMEDSGSSRNHSGNSSDSGNSDSGNSSSN